MTFALVYQVGIANVFRLGDDEPRRVYQHTYGGCEHFCAGLIAAGATVAIFHADVCGDCRHIDWAQGKGDLWAHQKHPPVQDRTQGARP